jgi:hypothetical protein
MRPITPQPGHTENEVIDLMDSGQFVYADCFTVIPKSGSPLRYTTAQQRVSVVPVDDVARQTYTGEVLITGLQVKMSVGVEVDQQQLNLHYPDTAIYQAALTWAQALLQGRLDGAKVRRDRYIAARWSDPSSPDKTDWLGGMPMFLGLISTVDKAGRQSATVNVKSDLVLLDVDAPIALWDPNCKNNWGDVACGVDQSIWAVNSTISSTPTRSVIPWALADENYNQGKIHMDNGDSVTRVRTISRVAAGNLYLSYPLDFDPTSGQGLTVYPGCPKTTDPTFGCPKYHGVDWPTKFKGFPFIPVAETAF